MPQPRPLSVPAARTGRARRLLGTTLLFLATVVLVLGALFQLVYRPWQRTWGATPAEVARPMPGDEIISAPTFIATRAVTIEGRPEEIWPWIVQIGYLRAGFYSYDRLDNDGVPSAERILPRYQGLQVGDSIPLNNHVDAEVRALEPERSLLLVVGRYPDRRGAFTWSWGLYPLDAERTRLVTRLRWRIDGAVSRLLTDAAEIWMMRKCLLGIKRRVEGTPRAMAQAAGEARIRNSRASPPGLRSAAS